MDTIYDLDTLVSETNASCGEESCTEAGPYDSYLRLSVFLYKVSVAGISHKCICHVSLHPLPLIQSYSSDSDTEMP